MESVMPSSSCGLEDNRDESTIPHANRNLCRTLKMLMFVVCLTGFGYQTTEFLANFYTYPTVINLDVKRIHEFPLPALTFCSKYLYNFTKYCKLHPEHCEAPERLKSFCRDQPHKCIERKTKAVTPKVFPTLRAVNGWKEIKSVTFNTSDAFLNLEDDKYFQGPFYLMKTASGYEVCFRAGNGFGPSGLRTTPKVGSRIFRWQSFGVSFSQDNEIFYSREAEPYGTLYIHSPFLSFRTSTKSVILKTHMEYNIYIRLEQERLLPSPYESNCLNYEALWKKNKTSPVSREMCEYMCAEEYEPYYEHNGVENIYYEEKCISILESDSSLTTDQNDLDRCKCRKMCKDECLKLNYDFSLDEHRGLWVDEIDYRDFRRTYVNLLIEKDNVRVLSYKPQYMNVELFSYVGGFIGCWLGISLWTSTGMLGRGFATFRSNTKKYRKSLRKSSKNIADKL